MIFRLAPPPPPTVGSRPAQSRNGGLCKVVYSCLRLFEPFELLVDPFHLLLHRHAAVIEQYGIRRPAQRADSPRFVLPVSLPDVPFDLFHRDRFAFRGQLFIPAFGPHVPMSRPSMTTPLARPISCCIATSLARTSGMLLTELTRLLTSMRRISVSTFSPFR